MSLLAAYVGPPIALQTLLMPARGRHQYAGFEASNGHPSGADGFGFGWFLNDGPHRYVRTRPVWQDVNVADLAASLRASVWLTNLQGNAPDGVGMSIGNIQPFRDEQLLFMHQGFIEGHTRVLLPACLEYLSPQIMDSIQGHSAGEYLFAMIRQRLLDPDHLALAPVVQDVLGTLEVSLRDRASVLNLVVSDGRQLLAARQATGQDCPPLYFAVEDADFPGAALVASEPLTEGAGWRLIPEHHLLALSSEGEFRLTRL